MWSRSRTSISSIRCFSVGGLFLAQWFIIITGFILFVGCHLAHFCSMSVEHTFVELRSRRRHRSFSVFRNNSLFHYEIPISFHFKWFYSKNKKIGHSYMKQLRAGGHTEITSKIAKSSIDTNTFRIISIVISNSINFIQF